MDWSHVLGHRLVFYLGLSVLVWPTTLPASSGSSSPQLEFHQALPGYTYSFPRDHGSHDEFKTEWWYYTGHLVAHDGRRFGYELTFFRRAVDDERVWTNPSQWAIRQLYFAHFALSDEETGRFRYAEKISRAGLGKAGAKTGRLETWVDQWRVQANTPDHSQQQLRASAEDFAIDLRLMAQKPPIVHGQQGVSRKGDAPGQASHYYSLTRLTTNGILWVDGERFEVSGATWMDHEFGSGELGEDQVGWDWFSVQLDSGLEFMAYQLRREDGTPDPASSGTMIFADGTSRHLSMTEIDIQVRDHWVSQISGARYPRQWHLRVPSLGLSLDIAPRMPDQELVTRQSTQVTYWEGAVDATGTFNGSPVTGRGYVELTGYAEKFHQKL